MDKEILRKLLIQERPVGEALYEPVEELKDWRVHRKDCPARLKYIINNLQGETVLDIGCAEGYFTRELARIGYRVTAIDMKPNLISVVNLLCQGLDVSTDVGEWEELVKGMGNFDNILFLSIFHNDVKRVKIEGALSKLHALRGKCNKLFIEVPSAIKERSGLDALDFRTPASRTRLEQAVGMSIVGSVNFYRTIFICT